MRIIVNYKLDFYRSRLKDKHIRALVVIFLASAIILMSEYLYSDWKLQNTQISPSDMKIIERRLPEAQYGRWSDSVGRGGTPVSVFHRIRFRIDNQEYDLCSYTYEGDLEKLHEKFNSLKDAWARIGYIESDDSKDIIYLQVYDEMLVDPDFALQGLQKHAKMQNTIGRDMAVFCAFMLIPLLAPVQIKRRKK